MGQLEAAGGGGGGPEMGGNLRQPWGSLWGILGVVGGAGRLEEVDGRT